MSTENKSGLSASRSPKKNLDRRAAKQKERTRPSQKDLLEKTVAPEPVSKIAVETVPLRAESGSVRIIAGSLRGSKLPVANIPGLRPTPDRIRETLFNWLQTQLPGGLIQARVLDLFAGTGALGFECVSRGAAHAVFCESNAQLATQLGEDAQRLKVEHSVEVVQLDAMRYLQRSSRASAQTASAQTAGAQAGQTPFELIFIDPPYSAELWQPVLEALQHSPLCGAETLFYLEAPIATTGARLPPWNAELIDPVKQGRAGAVQFGLYRFRR